MNAPLTPPDIRMTTVHPPAAATVDWSRPADATRCEAPA
jgi:hypothetical protein